MSFDYPDISTYDRFYLGDKVKILERLNPYLQDGVTSEMEDYQGREVTLETAMDITRDSVEHRDGFEGFYVQEDDGRWFWNVRQFEPKVVKRGAYTNGVKIPLGLFYDNYSNKKLYRFVPEAGTSKETFHSLLKQMIGKSLELYKTNILETNFKETLKYHPTSIYIDAREHLGRVILIEFGASKSNLRYLDTLNIFELNRYLRSKGLSIKIDLDVITVSMYKDFPRSKQDLDDLEAVPRHGSLLIFSPIRNYEIDQGNFDELKVNYTNEMRDHILEHADTEPVSSPSSGNYIEMSSDSIDLEEVDRAPF